MKRVVTERGGLTLCKGTAIPNWKIAGKARCTGNRRVT